MASDEPAMFSRNDLEAGLAGRRATTLLFAIENRTAHLVAATPHAVPIVLSERAVRQRERAFLDALARGRDLPVRPTIRNLERHAPRWADLVPDDPALRAELASLLGAKYRMPAGAVPRIRAVLGLDTDAVRDAHLRAHGTPLATIYATEVGAWERLRWTVARLTAAVDRLPAFWIAFFLTLIIGAVNLALPIAVAGVGALPGVGMIIGLGLLNMITIAAMVEVVMRTGSIRNGTAFLGTVVGDYLGSATSIVLSVVLTVFSFGLLLILYLGISTTLADATSVPPWAWIVVLCGIALYFLTRGSLTATVASSIVITAVNVVLLVVLTGFAFSQLDVEHLGHVNMPWSEAGTFEPILLGAVVGVVLDLYAAHILVAIFGSMLLERDPSGRSVVRGHVAGIGFAMVLNVAWVIAVCGAIAPEVLAAEKSTALVPLADAIGPHVRVIGAVFVVLSMGLGLIQFSLALVSLARERIGDRPVWGGERGRLLLSLVPVGLVVLVAEWMVLTGTGSFAGILGFLGVMVHSLVSGALPMLLLVASRRRGDIVPGVSYAALGNPLVVGTIFALSLGNLLLHGLVVWEDPPMRIGGLLIGGILAVLTVLMVRRGTFAPGPTASAVEAAP